MIVDSLNLEIVRLYKSAKLKVGVRANAGDREIPLTYAFKRLRQEVEMSKNFKGRLEAAK